MLSPLALVTLSMFDEQPRHAYDVYATMRQRHEERLVKLSAGTLYHAINRLAEQGLLQQVGTECEGNRPERTVLRITAAGRAAMAEALREMLATPATEYPQFRVAIAEMHHLPADEAVQLLRERAEVLTIELDHLEQTTERLRERRLPDRLWLDLDLAAAAVRAEHDWCRRIADEVARGALDWTSSPIPSLETR